MAKRRERGLGALVLGLGMLWMTAPAHAAIWYVNPASGNDGNSGAAGAPFKTIGKALTLARDAANTVVLAPGTYSTASGERFGWTIASGKTTFIGSSAERVVIDAAGAAGFGLRFGNNGYARFVGVTLQNMSPLVSSSEMVIEKAKLVNFAAGLRVGGVLRVSDADVSGRSGFVSESCALYLTRVTVDGADDGGSVISALAGATVVADELVIHDVVGEAMVIDVLGGSQVELRNSSIVDSWGTSYVDPENFLNSEITIRVGADSSLWLVDSHISGSPGIAVFGDITSTVKIDGGSYTGNLVGVHSLSRSELNSTAGAASTAYLRNTLANWRVDGPDAIALLDDADFRSGTFGVQSYDRARVSVSNSTFRGVSRPIQLERADAGQTSRILGHNLYFYGAASNYSSVVASCHGPTPVYLTVTGSQWRPNTQGSDENGYFEPQTISGIKKGNNYWLKTSLCRLEVN